MTTRTNTPRDAKNWDVELLEKEVPRPPAKRAVGLAAVAAAVLLVCVSGFAVNNHRATSPVHAGQASLEVLEERRLVAVGIPPADELPVQHLPQSLLPRRRLQTTGSTKVQQFKKEHCGGIKPSFRSKGAAALFNGLMSVACEIDPANVAASMDTDGAVGLVATLGVTAVTLFAPGGFVVGPLLGMILQANGIPSEPEEQPDENELMILEQLVSIDTKLNEIKQDLSFLNDQNVKSAIGDFEQIVIDVENKYDLILDPQASIYEHLEDPTKVTLFSTETKQFFVDAKKTLAVHWEGSKDSRLMNMGPWYQLIKLWDNKWMESHSSDNTRTITHATGILCGRGEEYAINKVFSEYKGVMDTIKDYSQTSVKPEAMNQMLVWTGNVYDLMLSFASRKRAACAVALLMDPIDKFDSSEWEITWSTFDKQFKKLGTEIKTEYFNTYKAVRGLSNGKGREFTGPARVAVCNDSKYPLRSYAIGHTPNVGDTQNSHSSFYPRVKIGESELLAKTTKAYTVDPHVTVLQRGECKWDVPEEWASKSKEDVKYWLGSECFFNNGFNEAFSNPSWSSSVCGWNYGGKYVGDAELSPLLYDAKNTWDDAVLFVVTDQAPKANPVATANYTHVTKTLKFYSNPGWGGIGASYYEYTWPSEAPEAVGLDQGTGPGMLMLSGTLGNLACNKLNVGNKNVGPDRTKNCGGLGDARLDDDSFETAFEMSIEHFLRTDFGASGGLGKYYATGVDENGNAFLMTDFASKCDFKGRKIAVEFHTASYYDQFIDDIIDEAAPRRVVVRATEDCFETDANGSLAINVEVGDYGTRLYIASGKADDDHLGRGVCVHSNSWGQSTFNCDGDVKQRCGSGLFSKFADNEFTDCGNFASMYGGVMQGFWNDPVVPGTSDHAQRDEQGGTCWKADACIDDNTNLGLYIPRTIKLRIAKEDDERSQVAEYEYKGCFKDARDPRRDLEEVVAIRGVETGIDFKTCAAECTKRGFKFFGRLYTGKCRCGDSYGLHGEGHECNCANDSNLGEWNVCVYSISEFDKPDPRMAKAFGDLWGGAKSSPARDRLAEDEHISEEAYAEKHGLVLKDYNWDVSTPYTKIIY